MYIKLLHILQYVDSIQWDSEYNEFMKGIKTRNNKTQTLQH